MVVGMASSQAVPRVETTSGRVSVPADVIVAIEAAATRYGLSRDETAELYLRATLSPADGAAVALREVFESGRTHTPADVSRALKQAEADVPVAGVRLGSRRSVQDSSPISRDHIGGNLADDAVAVWPAARGLWKVSDRASILVAYRLGWPLAIYRVRGWEQDPDSGRRWAVDGLIISGDRRRDADTGDDRGELSPIDRAIANAVLGRALVLPAGAANPVIWLNSH